MKKTDGPRKVSRLDKKSKAALKRKIEREAEEQDRRADLNLGDTVMEIFGYRRPGK